MHAQAVHAGRRDDVAFHGKTNKSVADVQKGGPRDGLEIKMATFMLVRMPHITCSRGWLTAHGQLPLCFVCSLLCLLGPSLCSNLLLGSIEDCLPKGCQPSRGGNT